MELGEVGDRLIFNPAAPADWRGRPGLWVSANPVAFLSRATQGEASGLVVYVAGGDLSQRKEALELCEALAHHPASSRLPLVAVVSQRHRGLLASLAAAGVKWVVFRPSGAKLPVSPPTENPGQPLARVLREICPFLNHQPVDDKHELAYCGAYLNRLVLGRDRLLDLCENPAHQACPYFLAPRQAENDV
ncbi:MAG: hypothetical protein LDL11_06875 [Desulfarculus sp.]|nr:hypothetical protein [Desulfarculus sp.]